jgi:hypothetical protein
MADALDSKSSIRKNVWVQVPPPVLLNAALDFESNTGRIWFTVANTVASLTLVGPSPTCEGYPGFAKTAPKLGRRLIPY